VALSAVGGIVGIWLGYRFGEYVAVADER